MAAGGLIGAYVTHLQRRNLSDASVRMYRGVLDRVDALIGLADASPEQLEQWLDRLGLSPRARYSYVSALHGYYQWAIRVGAAETDPTVRMDRPRLPRRVPRPVATADLELALRMADRRMHLWLCLAAYQGLRCQEIAGVQVPDVLLGTEPPSLIVSHGKGDRERVLPLHPSTAMSFLAFGLPRGGFVFPRQRGPNRVGSVLPHTVSSQVARYLRSVGVQATAHQLRHWFGTNVYRESLDLRLTQELLGHADVSTTAGYVKFAQHKAADVIARL